MSILIVDDSDEARDIVAATLSSGGHNDFLFAGSGTEALEVMGIAGDAPKPQIDVVLLDVVMPEMDGIETCARIRAEPNYRNTPIVMITSLGDADTLSQAFVAGATDYLTKPFNRVELLARLRSALRLKAELDLRRSRESELQAFKRAGAANPQGHGEPGIDPLTGLADRNTMDVLLRKRANRPTLRAALVFQVDRLTQYGARYDEEDRERMLSAVVEALRALPAGLGDELFLYEPGTIVALLRDGSAASTEALARQAREAVRALALPHSASRAGGLVTLSIGGAVSEERTDARRLLAEAVAAMEHALGKGGDGHHIVKQGTLL